jgi:regulator of cell morphogenesis and NO signaling
MLNKNISELLEQNHQYASVMHWHGIDAFSYLNYTLDEVCKLKNIDTQNIQLELLKVEIPVGVNFDKLKNYAPSSLCHYLLTHHHHYAQRMLPVIEHHIIQTMLKLGDHYPQLHLLSNIFATFKSDFLKHISYENEKVFPYIKKIERYTISFDNSILVSLKGFSMQEFILKHHHDDDEMKSIRILLKNYQYDTRDALAYKVLMDELKAFENDLKEHSRIEEEILVPKALKMEEKLLNKTNSLLKLN